jgi:hypothetical protein
MALEIFNDIFLTTKKQTKIKNHNIYILYIHVFISNFFHKMGAVVAVAV